MTDGITDLLESVESRADPELRSDLETVASRVDELRAENERLREEKASLQTELKKTSRGTLELTSELEERYRELFENAIEGIYTTSESLDEYLLANPAFAELLGYEHEDALCSAVDSIEDDVFVDSERYAQYADTLRVAGEIDQFEYQVRTADGEIRWVSDSVRALTDEDGAVEGYRGAVIDITEKKHQQRDLKRQTNLAIVLNRVLRHNLRNDISVVRGHTQLMADKLGDDTNGEKVLDAIDGLISLTEKARLLDEIVAKDSEPKTADIPALINGVVTQIRGEYPSATISVVSDEGEQITARVLPSFRRAVQELVENAVKHSGDEPEIEVTVEMNPDDVRIRIADDGPGIDEQEASVLESGSETPLSHGSGLGLWLSYWIVTNQGGVIDATVTEAGTTLSVSVPRTATEGGQKQLVGMVKARDQYKSAFEEAGDGMTITDDEARILDVNKEAARIFGVDKDALIGRPIREFIPEGFDFEAEWGEMKAADMKRGEMNVVSADGGVSPIEYTAKSHIVPGQHLIVSRDITERKEREEELRKESARLETLFEKSPDMINVLDSEGTVTKVNRRFCEELGCEEQDIIGESIWELDREVTAEDVRALLADLRVDERRQFEGRYERRDGTTFPVEVHLLRFGLEGDDRFLAVSRDITERKEREAELRRIEERLRLAVEGAELGVWDWDMATDETVFTDQFVQMLGYSPEEFGESLGAWKERCHPDDRERLESDIEAHINGEKSRFDHEVRIQTGAGEWKWVQGIGQIVDRAEDGTPLRSLGIQIDISERKAREKEIRRLKNRLELAVEAGGVGIYDWNMTTDEVEFNDRFVQMLGYSPEEFGESLGAWKERCHPDDRERVEADIEAHINGESSGFDHEARVQTSDGEWKWVRGTGQIVDRDEDGDPLRALGTQLDISERKKREQELELAETVFQASQDALVLVDVLDDDTFRLKRVNEAYEALTGRSSGDVVGNTPRQNVGEAAGAEIESRYRQCVARRETIRFTQDIPSDGKPQFWETRLTPLVQDGDVTQLVAVARDVTEREARERE